MQPRSLAFAVLVVVAAVIGRSTTVEGTPVTLVWPTAGVAALWLLLQHGRPTVWRDAVLLGVVVAGIGLATGNSLPVAVALAVVEVGQALLVAWLYTRLGPPRSGPLLLDVRDLGRLLVTAGVATTAGAVVGGAVLVLQTGSWSVAQTLLWQSRNAASVLVVVALGLRVRQVLLTRRGGDDVAVLPFRMPTGWRGVEHGLSVVCSVLGSVAVFWWLPSYPIAFPLFAITAWVALRFDTAVTALRTTEVSVVAVAFTLAGHRPFAAIDDVLVRALIVQAYVALGAVLGLALALNRDERLVLEAQLRTTAADAQARSRQVQVLASASRAVHQADDARTAVCQAVREATGADGVYLIEPDGDGHLVSTSVVGLDLPPLCFSSDPTTSLTARMFTEGRPPLFAADVSQEPGISPALVEHLQIASAAWQPATLADDRVVAVIGVIWHQPVPELGDTTLQVLSVLGTEAARAIERGNLLEQLARAADRDQLTGLANRRRWDELAGVEVSRAHRSRLPLTLLLLDVDHFKLFNDTFGHAAGDVLLRDFAGTAADCLRDGDLIARWGGEEFAVALPDCTDEQALPVAERILATMPHGQTATVGIARWQPGESAADTLARADAALYRGKRAGRARAVLAGQPDVVPV